MQGNDFRLLLFIFVTGITSLSFDERMKTDGIAFVTVKIRVGGKMVVLDNIWGAREL